MPSIRSLFSGVALTTFTLLQISSASPAGKDGGGESCKPVAPALPLTGGPVELPATDIKLAHVALGRGVQNYTCTSVGQVGPKLLGAVAKLYDATSLASKDPKALNSAASKAVSKPLPEASKPLDLAGPIGSLSEIGQHYFNSDGVPVFELSTAGSKSIIYAAKVASVPAPQNADKGPANTGAVDWLFLNENTKYTSTGLKQVYRVMTAGGVAPVCGSVGVVSVEYATEYWFYK